MPYEKEELLNAAVCRVDALEAELIATKKVVAKNATLVLYKFIILMYVGLALWGALHEALLRQEELLAYIDSQEEAKFRKKKFCW
ncbi:Phosphatidylinositol/phosphatidylcholine transfer protein SFH4 [Vitis vinifera]|uniref:Phosphatidylinositol/phosphatidylcholine transfer protein SFH4 n=1 Tax=Vitis vinifera TaxID=29760 RepID=A0A438JT39_VITVI|nr:Phosphatidylinositol/phosphatidylcholine transfer protein SFH4 [Vitis vinifera]